MISDWTIEQEGMLEELLLITRDPVEIGRLLGRSKLSVITKLASAQEPFDPTALGYRDKIIAQDKKFQTAMSHAIELGLEHAPIGISRDFRHLPITADIISKATTVSGAGSPAA